MRMEGKIAVVTGASGHFGKAITLGYAKEGADLVVIDADLQKAEDGAAQVRALGRRALALPVDVTKKAEVEGMVERVVSEFGRIDVLVNCTGVSHNQNFLTFKEQDFDHCLGIGLKAYFLTCQVVGKQMATQGSGKIINLSSIVGRIGSGGSVGWSATRAGVDAMTRAVAQALGSYGVNVNALVHGGLEMFPFGAAEAAERRRRIPFGRLGKPEDLIGGAIFLATDDSNFVTGENLYVDGGYTTAAVTEDRFRPEWARSEHTAKGPRNDKYTR